MTTGKVVKTSNRGSKPGERRGGRIKGVPNKATASIREIAREYSEKAFNALVGVLEDEKSPAAAVVGAAKEILDRAYGKSTQPIAGDDEAPPIRHSIDMKKLSKTALQEIAALAANT